MSYPQIIAVAVSVIVLIAGLSFILAKAWDDFMRPNFKQDEQVSRDVEELIANNKPQRKRAF